MHPRSTLPILFPMALLLFLAAAPRLHADNAVVGSLLPRPRQVEVLSGSFRIEAGQVPSCRLGAPTAEAMTRLRRHWVELGLPGDPKAIEPEPGGSFQLALGNGDGQALPELAEEARAEGYALRVTEHGVRVAAASERGLFYGMATLGQLLNAAQVAAEGRVPCLLITDWPALGMRGPHEDYGRDQLPTMDDHKRSIRTAARFKMNTYIWFIEPDHFVYDFDHEISTEYDRFQFDEIRELVAYARQYYIEVIPAVELLAHMEMTLRHERYQALSETGKGGGTLCPTC